METAAASGRFLRRRRRRRRRRWRQRDAVRRPAAPFDGPAAAAGEAAIVRGRICASAAGTGQPRPRSSAAASASVGSQQHLRARCAWRARSLAVTNPMRERVGDREAVEAGAAEALAEREHLLVARAPRCIVAALRPPRSRRRTRRAPETATPAPTLGSAVRGIAQLLATWWSISAASPSPPASARRAAACRRAARAARARTSPPPGRARPSGRTPPRCCCSRGRTPTTTAAGTSG